jgi:hypothetical protein
MGPLHGIPNMPCDGGHLILIVQTSLRLTTLSNPNIGANNGAHITSCISVQISNIRKAHRISKKKKKLWDAVLISKHTSNKIQHCTLSLPLSCPIFFLPCFITTDTWSSPQCVFGCMQCCLRWKKHRIQPSACHHLSLHPSMPFIITKPGITTLCQTIDAQRLQTKSPSLNPST